MSASKNALLRDWGYSPDTDVERALLTARSTYPALYPEGLQRPLQLLEKLGNPHLNLPPIFHVAGTNGKGSTLAFLQAVFEAAGLSVHKYTSPHLARFEERFTINGKNIESDLFLETMADVSAAAKGLEISFFEFFTVVFFLAAQRSPADVVLLETGLGGTFDATNVITRNACTLLTRISYDHTRILGHSLSEIASNKAGIIKQNCPVVIAPQPDPTILDVFQRRAQELNAPLYLQSAVAQEQNGFMFDKRFHLPLPALAGDHQLINATTALTAIAKSTFHHLLQQDILEKAMRNVTWAGRLQRLTHGPLFNLIPEGWEIWLDGAHNDSGAETLATHIKSNWQEKPLFLVMGMKKSKEASDFIAPLLPYPMDIRTVDSPADAPMLPAAELAAVLHSLGFTSAQASSNLETAFRSLPFANHPTGRIIIAGSLYLVGHVLREHG